MKLDVQQQEIVDSESKNILVVAGAGSGKTKVLTERIKRLYEDGVPSSNIVAITFTNMATEEMRNRLQDIPTIGDSFIGTIHSFANKIYKTSGVNYQILNSEVEQKVYHEVLSMPKFKEDLSFKRWLGYRDLQAKVEKFQADESELEGYFLPSEQAILREVRKVVKDLYKKKGIIDFAQLLKHALNYFKSTGAKLEHLFVDELQDIGNLEFKFLKTLNAENYFLVGDDWQSIYSFSGGDVTIFKDLVDNEEFDTFYLENNYRNCQKIADLGKKIILQLGDEVIPKGVNVKSKSEGLITFQSKNRKTALVSLIGSQKNIGKWFLLTRSNKEIYELSELLQANNIVHAIIKKGDYSLEELNRIMDSNVIKLLTVHSSKGLENDNVILYGNFPLMQPSYLRNNEERKVMYVGVTRAKNQVHIFN